MSAHETVFFAKIPTTHSFTNAFSRTQPPFHSLMPSKSMIAKNNTALNTWIKFKYKIQTTDNKIQTSTRRLPSDSEINLPR